MPIELDFPSNPSVDDLYSFSDKTWKWNGDGWEKVGAGGATGATGATGPVGDYVESFNGVTGAVTTNAMTLHVGGLSADAGATFGGDILVNSLTVGKGGGNVRYNTVVGSAALEDNTSGNYNTAVGHVASAQNTEGIYNVGVGHQALYTNTTGSYNVGVGPQALYGNSEGSYNSALGRLAGNEGTTGSNNTYIGYNAQPSNATASNEIVLGDSNVTLIHSAAGMSMGGGATFGGDISVNDLTVGKGGGDVDTNTAVGYQALYSNINESFLNVGKNNVVTGYQALYSNTVGASNVASGYRALYSNTVGDSNVASGNSALYSNTGGNYNVASGLSALKTNTVGWNNVATGYHALYYNTTGNANVASGYRALYNNTEGDNNVASGYQALYSNTEGDKNSAFGHLAGRDGTTGSNNTYIGHNAQPSSATASNEIVLGDSNVTLIHSAAGMSMDGGATFGGDIIIPDGGYIKIGGDTESIFFNGVGGQFILSASAVDINQKLRHNGDSDTYLEFTTNNISLQAGGTDVLNITSTGANFADQQVSRPELKDYSETVNVIGTITDDFQVDLENGNVHTVTIGGDCEVDFLGFPVSGKSGTVTLIITNGGAHTVSWITEVKWPGDNAPALTASGVDIVSFMSIDGGNTIYGFVGGINFS